MKNPLLLLAGLALLVSAAPVTAQDADARLAARDARGGDHRLP